MLKYRVEIHIKPQDYTDFHERTRIGIYFQYAIRYSIPINLKSMSRGFFAICHKNINHLLSAACAAAMRAIGILNGEQLT